MNLVLCKELQPVLNCFDFTHIFFHTYTFFLSVIVSSINPHEHIQENRFNKLLKKCQPRPDPGKVIFDYSNIYLSYTEKSLLVKGFKFSIP